jgi:hydrogenase maturation factor
VVAATADPSAVMVRDGQRDVAVSLLTLDGNVEVGEWLLVHCGLALSRLTEPEALDALSLRSYKESP